MTIEQLLEALPDEIKADFGYGFSMKLPLHTEKLNKSEWGIFYGYTNKPFYYHKGSLREALEAVYQDLKDNNLL